MKPARAAAQRWETVAWALVALGVALLGLGFLNRSRPIEVLGCEPAALQRVTSKWVQLTNCQLDLAGASTPELSPGRRPSRLYVPLRTVNETGAAPVLLISINPIQIATFLQLRSLTNASSARVWIAQHLDMAFPRRDVRAIVRQRMGSANKLALKNVPEGMAPGYMVLEEAGEQGMGGSVLLKIAGGSLVVIGITIAVGAGRASKPGPGTV